MLQILMTNPEYTSTTEAKVKGDTDAVAASGDFFLLSPPPGVNPQTGTLASIIGEDVTWYAWTANGPSQYLWAHYKYMTPMAGFSDYSDGETTVGAQSGANKLGNYHCNNRVYNILQGRWTSIDQAAEPWWNLWEYGGSNLVGQTDPEGLFGTWQGGLVGWVQRKLGWWAPTPGYPTHNSITALAVAGSTVPVCAQGAVMCGAVEIDLPGILGGHAETRAFHADDIELMDETATWIETVRKAGEYLQTHKNCKCMGTLARLAGMAAHTIQDFYHHSNWFFKNKGKRWNEKADEATLHGIAVGSGWAQPGSASEDSDWHHDPYGDIKGSDDTLPEVPAGYDGDRLKFLKAMVDDVVIPHTRDFLSSVFGPQGTFDNMCCYRDDDHSPQHLKECFGEEIGHTLYQFLKGGRGSRDDWETYYYPHLR